MYQSKINIAGKTVAITAESDRCAQIASNIQGVFMEFEWRRRAGMDRKTELKYSSPKTRGNA